MNFVASAPMTAATGRSAMRHLLKRMLKSLAGAVRHPREHLRICKRSRKRR